MELGQHRKFGDEGRKTTHDFLSLCSPAQQDPLPSQGNYLKTHDFLQPLEGSGKNGASGDNNLEASTIEKPPPPAPPPEPSITHILPGGIGTYSISYYEQKAIKQEGSFSNVAQVNSAERNDENSNCSSYSGSGFALWDESVSKTGKTGKENIALERHKLGETSINLEDGAWTTSLEQRSHSSASHKLNNTALSSLSSSQQPIEKYPSFTNLLRSSQMAEEDDNEEFVIKKETSNLNDNLTVNVDGRSADKKPSTPRSKHSATEQRRRCKINDRFQKLREIIPHGDQKRDKASFLLEVIEYIQYLQEKVHRYEVPDQGGNPEPSKEVIQQPEFPNKTQKQQPVFPFGATFSSGLAFDINKPAPQQPHVHFQPRTADGAAISDHKVEDEAQQQSIESGTIRISSVYSQQLLNSLTQALQHSGVDLSRASVAVQIDLGKRAKSGLSPSISTSKDNIPMNMSNQARSRSLTAVTEEEYDQALKKRLKASRN